MTWHLNSKKPKVLPHNPQASRNDEIIRLYRSETDEDEKEKLLNTLVIENKPLILSWAKYYYNKYINYNIPFNDLVQEASLALIKSLPRYELPEFQNRKRTATFSTFSSWYIRKGVSIYCKTFYNSIQYISPYGITSQPNTIENENAKEPIEVLETNRLQDHLLDLDDHRTLLELIAELTTPEELIIYAVYNGIYGYDKLIKSTIRKTATILNLPVKYTTSVIKRVNRLLKEAVDKGNI